MLTVLTWKIENLLRSKQTSAPAEVQTCQDKMRIRIQNEGTVDIITAHLKAKLVTLTREGGSSFSPRNEDKQAQMAGIGLMRRSAESVTLRVRTK
jgi:hypothetical protein